MKNTTDKETVKLPKTLETKENSAPSNTNNNHLGLLPTRSYLLIDLVGLI
jgi:hypothetical protein